MNDDSDGEDERWSGAKRKMRRTRGERGVDNEKEGSETEREEAKGGLWGKGVVMNKAEGD